jgi:hypothetical protein
MNEMKTLLLFSLVLAMCSENSLAVSLKEMKSKWAFDTYEVKDAKCFKVDEKILSRKAKTNVECKDHGGSQWSCLFTEKESHCFRCKGKSLDWAVFDDQATCKSNLETMKMNAD